MNTTSAQDDATAKNRDKLYNLLYANGYKQSYDEFSTGIDASEDNRRRLFDLLSKNGYKQSYDAFSNALGYPIAAQNETEDIAPKAEERPQASARTTLAGLVEQAQKEPDYTQHRVDSIKNPTTFGLLFNKDYQEELKRVEQEDKGRKARGETLPEDEDGTWSSWAKADKASNRRRQEAIRRINERAGQQAAQEQAWAEEDETLKQAGRYHSVDEAKTREQVMAGVRQRFAETETGKGLAQELHNITESVTSRIEEGYMGKLKQAPAYAQLIAQLPGGYMDDPQNAKALLQTVYGDKISEEANAELAPYYEAYDNEVRKRYGVDIDEAFERIGKQETTSGLETLRASVDSKLARKKQELNGLGGYRQYNAMEDAMTGGAHSKQDPRAKQASEDVSTLRAAQKLLSKSENIIREASKKGKTNFVTGVGRGMRDTAKDVDTWTMGITEFVDANNLQRALSKAEKGESLTEAEEALLDASVANMATQVYFGSDLGRGYKAGQTTMASVPFMLEMIANPISSTGSAIAKRLLKYGLKKWSTNAVAKGAARLVGDAVAAAGMEATSGLGHVAAGTMERLNQNYVPYRDENGNMVVDKARDEVTGEEKTVGLGEAIARSAASTFLENQSEMVFNAFAGGRQAVANAVMKVMPGAGKRTVGKVVSALNRIKNSPIGKLEQRAQFHGIFEEYMEEVYNNMANVAMGEMSMEDATSLDTNLDTFLGLTPTSLFFGGLHLGYGAYENQAAKRQLRQFANSLSEDDRKKWNKVWDDLVGDSQDLLDELTERIMSDTRVPDDEKERLANQARERMSTERQQRAKAMAKKILSDQSLPPYMKKAFMFAIRDMMVASATNDAANAVRERWHETERDSQQAQPITSDDLDQASQPATDSAAPQLPAQQEADGTSGQQAEEQAPAEEQALAIEPTQPMATAERANAARGFKRAERKARQVLSPDVFSALEQAGDGDAESFAEQHPLSEEQREAVDDYLFAKPAYQRAQEEANTARTVVLEQARSAAEQTAGGITNDDGTTITLAKGKHMDKPVYIVGGNLAVDDEGNIDVNNSTETIYYQDPETGERKMGTAQDFAGIEWQMTREQYVDRAVSDAEKAFNAEADAELQTPDIHEPAYGVTFIHDGQQYMLVMPSEDEPGKWDAQPIDEEGRVTGASIQVTPEEYYADQEAALWPALPEAEAEEQAQPDIAEQVAANAVQPQAEPATQGNEQQPAEQQLAPEEHPEQEQQPTATGQSQLPASEEQPTGQQVAPEQAQPQQYGVYAEQPQAENAAPDNGQQSAEQPMEQQAKPTQAQPQQTALQRIPKDTNGDPLFDEADADTAWDALTEAADGSEEIASRALNNEVARMEKELEKMKKQPAKNKTGGLMGEIRAEKEKQKAIDEMQKRIDHRKAMLAVPGNRAEAEQRRQQEEAAAREAQRLAEAEQRRIQQENERAEQEEAARREAETLRGVPNWTQDTDKAARARGYRRVEAGRYDRQEPVEATQGAEVEVRFRSGEAPARGRYAIVDAGQLQPSHNQGQRNPRNFILDAQPKDRADGRLSETAAQRIANEMRPEEITAGATAYTGAPVVNARGEVIQGNNRADALKYMHENTPESAAKYKAWLKGHAEEFGLTAEQVDAMGRPVLVRMLDVDDETAVRLGQYTAQDTESGGIERIDPKRTLVHMGKKLSGFFSLLMENGTEDETFAQLIDRNGDKVIKWMANSGFISATQAKSAFDRKGNLTAEAKNDLKKLMFESVFRGGNAALAEKFDRIPVKTQNAILATAWRDNNSPDSQRMNADLQESIEALYELMSDPNFAKSKDMKDILRSIREWEAMMDFDTATGDTIQRKGKYSNFALRLAATYKAYGQKATESILNRIYDLVQGKAEATLFEEADSKPRTLAEAIKEVLNIEYDGKNRSDLLGSHTTRSEEGRGGILGNTPSGEQATSGERRTDGGAGAAGVLGAERGVAADNTEREGATRATEAGAEAQAQQGANVAAQDNTPQGKTAPANEERQATQRKQGSPSGEQLRPQESRANEAQSQSQSQSQSQNAAQAPQADSPSARAATQDVSASDNGAAHQQEHGTESTSQQAPTIDINGKGEIDIINEAAERARAQQLREKFHKRPGAKPAKDDGPTTTTHASTAQAEGRRADTATQNASHVAERQNSNDKAATDSGAVSKSREQYLKDKAARKAQEARDKLKKGMGRLGAGVPVDVMLEALTPCVEWAACQIELGVRKLADFTKSLVAEFGEAIRPYAKMLFTGAQHLVGLEDIDSEFYTEGSEYAMLMIKNNGMSFPDFVQMMREEFGEAFDPYLKSFYDTAREMLEMQGNPIAGNLSPAEDVKSFNMHSEGSDKTVSSQAEDDSQSQERTNPKDKENADVHSNDTGSIHERTGEPAQPGPDNEGSDSGRDDTSGREDGGRRSRSDRGRVSVGATDEDAGAKDGSGKIRREDNGSRGDNHANTGSGVRSDDAGGRGHSGGGRRDNAGAVRGANDERNPGRNGHTELEGEKQAKGDSKGKPSGSDDRVPYVPTSKAPSAGTVMPALQAAQLYDALHSDVFGGDIDQFVVDKLKYKDKDDLFSHFSAEQIEGIALAIAQMDKGGGFILGDMTGIGKGRQGAALIRYAVLQGLKPVYFTAKPQLFSDVYRDLVDIGSGDLVPFIFASSQEGAVTTIDDNGDMHVVHAVPDKSERQALYDELAKTGKLPKRYDFVLCTYSQIQNGTQTYGYDSRGGVVASESRRADAAARSGQKAREALTLLMRNSFAILDEAHLAAGTSDTGMFLQSALAQSKATLFMSATYAKRPDNMPLYSGNTGMALSGLSPSDMIKAVIFGGLPLQEAISQQLVKSGQMVRRERDFTGVTIDWMQSNDNDKDRQWEAYGAIRSIFGVMMDAQLFVRNNMADVTTAARKKGLTASTTPFSSLLFPMFNQAVFALKAQQLADIAIEQIKAGKKPVITYNYTGDSVIDGMRVGEQTANDFNFILSRYFESLCTVTFKNRQGDVIETHHISEFISNKEAQALLSSMRSRIIQTRTGLPCSPVDTVVGRLKAAGYNVGEISGRKFSISVDPKTGSTKIVARRKASPRATAAEFNSGAIDALLLNRSGSTGISLHASRKFADQRPRVMISAQSQLDINDEVQIRGRIDRSGQVARGSYIYLTSLIPAEQRIQLSLRRKLKSLDANATSSQKSGFSDNEDVPDFINKYGDMAVLAVLRRDTKLCLYIGVNPEELEKLGSPAQSVLKRLVFLSPKLQEEVFDEIVEEYRATVKRAVDDGTYDLDVTAMDLGARVEARWLLANGVNPGAGNMFADNAYVDNCIVRRLRKPYSTSELAAEMAKARANHRTRSQIEESAKAYLAEKRKEFAADEDRIAEEARIAAGKEWSAKTNDANELAKIANAMADRARSVAAKANREKLAKIEKNTRTILEALASLQGAGVATGLEIGNLCTIPDNDNDDKTQQAVFLGYHISKSFSPSTSYALFAVPNDARTVRIPLSFVRMAVRAMQDYFAQGYKIKHVTDEWWATQIKNAGQSSDTDNRLIITGNLLIASNRLAKKGIKGRLVSFSMASGEQRLGILLPRKTAVSDLSQGEQVPISNAFSKIERNISTKQIALVTADKNVTIKFKHNGGALKLTIAVKKREGQLVGGAELQTAMRNLQFSTDQGYLADGGNSLTYRIDRKYISERSFDLMLDAVHRVLDVLDATGATVETNSELERVHTDVDGEKAAELKNALRASGKASVPVADVVDLLHLLDKDNSRANVIDAVSAALSRSNINVQFAPMTGTTQGYFSNDAQLCVNGLSLIGRNDDQDTLHTLLHEMIHAMSSNQLRGNYRTYDRRAVRVLNDLFKLAKGRLSEYYSSANCDEMVAELSDPDTRAELAALPVWAERSGKITLDVQGNARGWTGNYEMTNALAVAEEMLNALAATFDAKREADIASAIIGSRLSARFRKVGARDASASSTPSKLARVEVAGIAARLSEMFGVPAHVVDSADAITDKQARKAVEEGGDVKGWYDPNTGKVYLYAPSIGSEQDAMATYAHEVIAHKGMEGLLGKERYKELCERLGKALTPEQRKNVEAYEGSDDRTLGDEYIARIAETLIDENGNIKEPTTWEKVKAAVRDFFRDAFGLDLTDADIRYMLWRSAERLRREKSSPRQRARDAETGREMNDSAVRMRRESSPAREDSMREYLSRASLPAVAAITLLEQAGIPVEIAGAEDLEAIARQSMRDGSGRMKMLEQPSENILTNERWDDRRSIKKTRDGIKDLEPLMNSLYKRLSSLPSTLEVEVEAARTGSIYMHVLSRGDTPSLKIRFADHTKPFYKGIKGADYDASDDGVTYSGEDEIYRIYIDFSRSDFTEDEILTRVDEVRRLNESGLLAKYVNIGKREPIAVAAEYAKERDALVSRLQKEFPTIHDFVIASLDSAFLSNIDTHCIEATERLEKAAQKAQIERFEKFVRELSARPFVSANGYKVSYPSDYIFGRSRIFSISDLLNLIYSYGSRPALSVVDSNGREFVPEYTATGRMKKRSLEQERVYDAAARKAWEAAVNAFWAREDELGHVEHRSANDSQGTSAATTEAERQQTTEFAALLKHEPEIAALIDALERDKQSAKHAALSAKDRRIYGAAVGGKVYINGEALDADTPLHEYTHLWDTMVQRKNPELWKRGVELMKQTPLWDEVMADPNYAHLTTDDEIASEVHARLVGEYGSRLLEEMAKDESTPKGVIDRLRQWLEDVWASLKETLSEWTGAELDDLTMEQFNAMTMRDLSEGMNPAAEFADARTRFSIRQEAPPQKTGTGYKVFVMRDGKLYPPMVANPDGADTPVGIWLNADAAPIVGYTKTGRPQVKAGGKGTRGGSGKLAYRPGWHLGQIPYAKQFNRLDKSTRKRMLFPADFVWAEVEYAADVDYQAEARANGMTKSGKYRHSYAGLKRLPENGSYIYRTNADPTTDPWIITGAMRVFRLLTPTEVDNMVREAGRRPQRRQEGAVSDEQINEANERLFGESEGSSIITREELSDIADEMSARLHTPVRIVESVNEVDNAEAREALEAGEPVMGWYDTETGEVVLYRPNITDAAEATRTLLHEVVGHKGLRGLFGEENYDKAMLELFKSLPKDVQQHIIDEAMSRYNFDIAHAMDEYLAEQVERAETPSWWGRAVSMVRNLLRAAGFGVELSNADVRYLLWRSSKKLEKGEEGAREDNAMRDRLGISPNSSTVRFRTRHNTPRPHTDSTAAEYERSLKGWKYKGREAYQDSMLALKKLQEVVSAHSGRPLKSTEDAYTAENHLSSKNTAQCEQYGNEFFRPMMEAIAKLIKGSKDQEAAYREVCDYAMAKHGLERNEVFARRDAEREAEEFFAPKYKELEQQLAAGDISKEKYAYEVGKLDQKKAKRVDTNYEKNRGKDYSGLTALTGEDNVAAAEKIAQQMVDDYESKHDTADLWGAINAATKETLRKSYDAGLMTKEVYDKVRKQFKYYIPLRGFDETTAEDVYEYLDSETSPVNSVLRSAVGRKSLADDPFATIGNMAESTIFQANRNLMKQRFLEMALAHPSDVLSVSEAWYVYDKATDSWRLSTPDLNENDTPEEVRQKIADHEAKMRQLALTGEAKRAADGLHVDYRMSRQQEQEHAVHVKRGGKEYIVYVNGNPRAAQALNGKTNPSVEQARFWQWLERANRWMAANFTTRSPAFIATNLSRDLIYSMTTTAASKGAKYGAAFAANIPRAMATLARHLSGKGANANGKYDKYYREFLENGGETGYANLRDVNEYKKFVQASLKQITGKRDYLRAVRAGWKAFALMNRWAENVSRLAAYITAREKGANVFDAVSEAKEVTVNFNKKGAGYKTSGGFGLAAGSMRSLFLFFNAGVQGLNNFGRIARQHPRSFITLTGGFAAAGFMMPVLNKAIMSLMGDGDGDDDDYYANLSEWTRRNNICVYAGGGKFVTIPLPIELRAFYGLGEMAYQAAIGNDKTDGRQMAYDAFNQIGEILPLNPLGNNGDIVATFTPDALKPLMQHVTNKDFTGKPIRKENDYNKRMPEWTKTYAGTNQQLKALSEWANEVTGGDKYTRGWANLNPATVEHYLEGYFGGMATVLNQAGKTIYAAYESVKEGEVSEDLVWRNAPVLSRFVGDATEDRTAYSKLNRRYYELYDAYKDVQQRLNGYKSELGKGNFEYLEPLSELQNSDDYKAYQIFNAMQKRVSKLQSLQRKLPEAGTREARKSIEEAIVSIKQDIIEAIDGVEEQ